MATGHGTSDGVFVLEIVDIADQILIQRLLYEHKLIGDPKVIIK